MISDHCEPVDMVAAAAAENSRRKRRQAAGLAWTLAGALFLTAGGYYGDPPVIGLAGIGYFVAWGALSWLSGRRRLRIPCPACGKKSESDEAIAFRRCQFCGGELFAAPNASPFFPGEIAFHAPPRRNLTVVILVFGLSGGIFYGIAVWLWPLGNSGFSDEFIIRQMIFTAAALPCAAAVLFLRQRHLERVMPVCPVCKVGFSPFWANASGNCNRCGATLLEIFEPEPGPPLPSADTVDQYWQKSEIVAVFVSLIIVITWTLMVFFDCAPAVMTGIFAGMFGAGIAILRILERHWRRKLNLGNCPSCGGKVPWFVRPRRCPECGRRVIATGSRT